MVFSSNVFLFVFLPVLLGVYYLVPAKFQNSILFLFSLFFYAWGEPVYLILMIFSIVFNYVMGLDLESKKKSGKSIRGSMVYAVSVNLFLLGFFKYGGFLIENIEHMFRINIPWSELPLPVGLSFYTFQALSYLSDIASGRGNAQKNLLPFGLYIAMFPQLVAGPIVQYSDINEQLMERKTSREDFGEGTFYLIWGLAKKVLLANGMGKLFETVGALPELSTLSAWIGALAYTFQIYFDFSGYSDMAVGLGRMFGFRFPHNFDHPYMSKSVTEFWRRWHISLGKWFRDYVYIPLGGNRVAVWRHIGNILVVWILTGLWHGASWNFVLWGFYYGVVLIIEKYMFRLWLEKLPFVIQNLYTLLIVVIGWVLFFSDTWKSALSYLSVMFLGRGKGLFDQYGIYLLMTNAVSFLICLICSTTFLQNRVRACIEHERRVSVYMMCFVHIILFLLSTAYLISDTYNPFLYFRF